MSPVPTIGKDRITGLVLAGGRGSRMGGVDKGLQNFRGMPLAMHALMRLQAQVGETLINANRNIAAYESMGVPVWPDAVPDYPGPLAGFLAGLERCETSYLVVVPCDSPLFPEDLVERLAGAFTDEGTEIAVAATREGDTLQAQPVFCMLRADLMESLVRFVHSGPRKIDRWTALHATRLVAFEYAQAFANANTMDELQQLQRP